MIAPATDSEAQRKKSVVTQLFYMAGELDKAHGGHGRFAYVDLEDVEVEPLEGGLERVSYRARLPVAFDISSTVARL